MNLSFNEKVMLGVRIIYIYIVQPPLFSLKHHPRALRTRHSLNESNVLLQHTLLAKFYTENIFKALHISSVHLLALIPAVAKPTRITPVQVRESTSVGSNMLQTVQSLGLSGNIPINHRMQDQTRYPARRRVQRYKCHHILHHRQIYYMSI
jgi:hypothetical protein